MVTLCPPLSHRNAESMFLTAAGHKVLPKVRVDTGISGPVKEVTGI